jgi:hypothetical protein
MCTFLQCDEPLRQKELSVFKIDLLDLSHRNYMKHVCLILTYAKSWKE